MCLFHKFFPCLGSGVQDVGLLSLVSDGREFYFVNFLLLYLIRWFCHCLLHHFSGGVSFFPVETSRGGAEFFLFCCF